ncbi:MAG: OmpW family outer membrane protein [Phenylobacterium sp.]
MPSFKYMVLAILTLIAFGTTAHAQDTSRWFVHAGPALAAPEESSKVWAGGAPVPGGSVSIDHEWTFAGELGYFVTPHVAVSVAAGLPPTFEVMGAGSLAGLGKAGEMTGGPAGLMVQYHFNPTGRIRPYVGAGAAFLVVFGTKDGIMTDLRAKSAVGTALQAGSDVMLNDRWGMFIDVKQAWVGTIATGTLGPAPVSAKVKIDPFITNFGVTYRF